MSISRSFDARRQGSLIVTAGILVFGVLAGIATLPSFPVNPVFYALTLTALVAAIAMLAFNAGPLTEHSAPAWLCVLVVLCAYVLKVILVAPDPASAVRMGALPRVIYGDTPVQDVLYAAMLLSAACCAPLCLAYALLLARTGTQPHSRVEPADPLRGSIWLLIIAACASLLSAWLTARYQIGLMGVQVTEVLPFRLRGIIYYFRMYALPGMLLYAIHAAYRSSSAGWVLVGIILLLGNGIFDSVIKASRSALLLPILSLFFLYVVAGYRFRYRHVIFIAAVLLPIMFTLPYIGQIRIFRQQGQDLASAMTLAFSAGDIDPLSSLASGVGLVLYRIPGYDMVVGILGHGMAPLGMSAFDVFNSERGVAGYLTVEGFFFPATHPHLSAPGFVGWWFLVGGWPLVSIGGVITAVLVHFSWLGLLKLNFPSSIVLRVFFLLLLFVMLTEGTLDSLGKMSIAMLASVAFLEIVVRLVRRFSRANVHV